MKHFVKPIKIVMGKYFGTLNCAENDVIFEWSCPAFVDT